MALSTLSVGWQFPGGFAEYVPYTEPRSLADGDIVLFVPDIGETYSHSLYMGKPSLSEIRSVRLLESTNHWRRELMEAVNTGKTVFIFLKEFQQVYIDKGRRTYSGTGRNRLITTHVELFDNYRGLPLSLEFTKSEGKEMKLEGGADVLSVYWREFAAHSEYRVYFKGEVTRRLVATKDGRRMVGALVRNANTGG